MVGGGLAGSLKKMWLNFQVLKPQMGLNNPGIEGNRFSLRRELFRIRQDAASDGKWQETLESFKQDDCRTQNQGIEKNGFGTRVGKINANEMHRGSIDF